MSTEEELIQNVIRIKSASVEALTVAQVHAALVAEGVQVELAPVKKAASKAAKRVGEQPVVAPAVAPAASEPTAAKQAKLAKQAAAQEKAKAAEIKSAENTMMEAHRKLRGAKTGDPSAPVTITGSAEDFVQQVTTRAITGILEEGDARFLKERIEADIATLEWIKLASASGALKLTEDMVALGGELQLARLKEVRGAKDQVAARACYVEKTGVGEDGGYEQLDRLMARAGGMAAAEETGDKMEEMD